MEIEEQWKQEQLELKKQLCKIDKFTCPGGLNEVGLIGGVDISFVKESNTKACACLVVLQLPSLETVYKDTQPVEMILPYIPGFLAFREVDFLITLIERLKKKRPDLVPHVIMVDGNGILHKRGFGLASHLGVLTDIPTIGVSKKWYQCSDLNKQELLGKAKKELEKPGDYLELIDSHGVSWGAALRSTCDSFNPIFISIGHMISLLSAVKLIQKVCKFRVPEPVRQADKESREWLRNN